MNRTSTDQTEMPALVQLVVLQPSQFCNIDCKYCYLPARDAHNRMSIDVLEQSFRFLFEQPGRLARRLVVAWHGGEPFAVPRSFYQKAFELLDQMVPSGITLEHWFQTNATLVNSDWCTFIKRWNIHIGVSIDGPQWLHDARRVDRAGRGTFSRVLRGIRRLQAENIDFSTIAVLGYEATAFPEEIWAFFRDLGATDLAFNMEEIEGIHEHSSLDKQTSFSRIESFFATLMELRDRESPYLRIREVDSILERIRDWPEPFRRMENVAGSIVCFSWTGEISTFSPELVGLQSHRYGRFAFGNVATHTLDQILTNSKLRRLQQEIDDGVSMCKTSCDYFLLCGGGTPSNKLHENGTFRSTETLACRLRIKAITSAVLGSLEQYRRPQAELSLSIPERIACLQKSLEPSPAPKEHYWGLEQAQ